MSILEASRILLSLSMLGYASWRDVKTREVSDLTWVVFGFLGLGLDIYELAAGSLSPVGLAIPVAFSAVLSFILAYLGLFGGADFKAFVVLSLLQPYPPESIRPALGIVSVIFPLTLFSNSAIAGAFMALVLLVRNLLVARRGKPLFEGHGSESRFKKLVVLISGIKVRLGSVRGPPFQYPLEEPSGEEGSGRRLVLMPDFGDDDAAIETFRLLRQEGVTEVWVSHTLPFIVFITFGFASALLLGDMVLWALMRILPPT